MDIMELGAIGELVGGIAVVASLVYVGFQVRQSNERSRQALALERAQANREMSGHFAEVLGSLQDPDLMELVQRAMSDWSALSVRDQGRAAAWVGAFHIHALSAFLARRHGLMDEAFADAWTDWYASFLHSPGLREWWRQTRSTHHQGFVEHIEGRLSSSDGPDPVHANYTWFSVEGRA